MQTLIVTLIVLACTAYAAWTLMPAAARRALATALLKLPLPAPFARRMQRAASAAASGCGCDGCDHAPTRTAPKAQQVVRFHPRIKR